MMLLFYCTYYVILYNLRLYCPVRSLYMTVFTVGAPLHVVYIANQYNIMTSCVYDGNLCDDVISLGKPVCHLVLTTVRQMD